MAKFQLVLGLVLAVVYCSLDTVAADDDGVAKKLFDITCVKEEKKDDFHKCLECCQAIGCYKWNKPSEPNKECRKKLYKNEKLVQETRTKGCKGAKPYSECLKDAVMDMKDEMLEKCNDSDGTEEVVERKIKCFENCKDGKVKDAFKLCKG